MMPDLVSYAREHRLRTRNLHDGAPVPPMRRPRGSSPVAYRSVDDRDDAIIGRYGYISQGLTRLEVYMAFGSHKGVRVYRERLQAAGATIMQEGDTELGAWAPFERIDEMVKLIAPYHRNPGPKVGIAERLSSGSLGTERQQAPGSTQAVKLVPNPILCDLRSKT